MGAGFGCLTTNLNIYIYIYIVLEIIFLVVNLGNLPSSGLFLSRVFTFDSVQSAQRAKASLNGADIYSGCCTLKIEYAKVTLQVLPTLKCTFKILQIHGCGRFMKTIIICLVFLQPPRLNVFKNDQDTWDYTNPNLGGPGRTLKIQKIWGEGMFYVECFDLDCSAPILLVWGASAGRFIWCCLDCQAFNCFCLNVCKEQHK